MSLGVPGVLARNSMIKKELELKAVDIEDLDKSEINQAFVLPGGNESMFVKRQPNSKRLETAFKLDAIKPVDYILDSYRIEVDKKEDGVVEIKISGMVSDGIGSGISFQIDPNTPYRATTHQIRSCFHALFKHQIQKVLKEQDGE